MRKKIYLVVLDIDGVLTDGRVMIDSRNKEYKTINYRDLDSVNYLRKRGIKFALLTGEDAPFVDILAKKFKIKSIIRGANDKAKELLRLSQIMGVSIKNICYIGDADRDAAGLKLAGISFVPKDATKRAKEAASHILKLNGGSGIVQELKEYLLEKGYLSNE